MIPIFLFGDHSIIAAGLQYMHPWLGLAYWNEAFLLGQEWMLLVGVNNLLLLARFSIRTLDSSCQGQIDKIIVVVDPEVLDGLQFHLFCLRIVSPDLLTHFQCANGEDPKNLTGSRLRRHSPHQTWRFRRLRQLRSARL